MKGNHRFELTVASFLVVLSLAAGTTLSATTAVAVSVSTGATLEARVQESRVLSDADRACMLDNLRATRALGIPASSLESVFPGAGQELSPATMLELQQAVIDAAVEGLPVDLILAKVREGRIKGVSDPQLSDATHRMARNVRSARRIVDAVSFSGDTGQTIPAARSHMMDEVAQQLWRGLTEEGYMSLCETGRSADESCDSADLVAAGEVAVRLLEAGVDERRALDFARMTIRRGYRGQEMRQIQLMVVTCHRHGGAPDEFMAGMEHCVNVDMGTTEMYGYMMRGGWMGPGDVHDPGDGPRVHTRGRGGQNEMERGKRQGEGAPDR